MTQTEPAGVSVPLAVRLLLGRAAVQVIATDVGADLLHIKGNAVDRSLRGRDAPGTDIDVMVRPTHIPRLHDALVQHGWVVYSSFVYGSPFGHAQTYRHPDWGYLDLHRMFPGIRLDPEAAFAELWRGRSEREFAGTPAAVPSVTAQALLLVLNDVRSRKAEQAMATWVDGPGLDRAEVAALVGLLDARVAFSAATGDLAQHRREPDYRLWKGITQGSTRAGEWWARARAAGTVREAAAILVRAPLANVERLTHKLGRAPTRGELVRATAMRPVRALRELLVSVGRRFRR
ncbi:nucleotidyltransferase family protein [Microbacterium sp. E-13]|uniref:nucleotidyltransferase family protein n=1 Tax=Microbacterium sp. E-13 TaxID=3404048 RepID=UPI003CEFF293